MIMAIAEVEVYPVRFTTVCTKEANSGVRWAVEACPTVVQEAGLQAADVIRSSRKRSGIVAVLSKNLQARRTSSRFVASELNVRRSNGSAFRDIQTRETKTDMLITGRIKSIVNQFNIGAGQIHRTSSCLLGIIRTNTNALASIVRGRATATSIKSYAYVG
jgi:hypothetical protein